MRTVFILSVVFLSFKIHAENERTGLVSTNLPLVIINTNGQAIVDEPKITVNLKIIYNPAPALNYPEDSGNVYDGLCGIEYRGAYSQTLPQKPYGFETRDHYGNNLNVSFLGMPAENDWILLASYNDKTFMRNTLAFHLFEKMGHYAPRNRFCEVIVNGEYQGIYILTEKIKRDKNRINIAKIDPDDNSGDSLTGGYIFKVDYYNASNSWQSNYSPIDRPDKKVYFVYEYPAIDVITSQQNDYLKRFVDSYESALYSDDFNNPARGYRLYLDIPSFIDYFIIGELSRNVDAYKKSAFFYKDRDKKGGLLHCGPVWDYDWAWKNMIDNCDLFAATDGSGWAYQVNECKNWPVAPAWMVRLFQDTLFQDQVFTRYTDLRKTILSEEYINHYIDSVYSLLQEAQTRHYEKWPILGINVGTPEVDEQPDTYEGEVEKFKNWITTRISWLDANMPGKYITSAIESINTDNTLYRLYPNPGSDILHVESDRRMIKIDIYNQMGSLIKTEIVDSYSRSISIADLAKGIYLIKTTFSDNKARFNKFIKI
jgi:hypothetical protein